MKEKIKTFLIFIKIFLTSPRLALKVITGNYLDTFLTFMTINSSRTSTNFEEIQQLLKGVDFDKLYNELIIFHICLVIIRAHYLQLPIAIESLDNYIKLVYYEGVKNKKEMFSLEFFKKVINQRYQEYFGKSDKIKDSQTLGSILATNIGEEKSAVTVAVCTSILGNTIFYEIPSIDNVLIRYNIIYKGQVK